MSGHLYSFVIVDDEPEIREGIRDTIPWEDLGFTFRGAFANGKEALEWVEQNPPDVLITDINMPFMDGLVLSELVLDRSPRTKVLIISGYDDFEYARKALQLQVHDYIVKPITPTEFKTTLVKLKTVLDHEREAEQDLERIKKQLAENLPLIKERFFNRLLSGSASEEETQERFKYFGVSLQVPPMALHCMVFDFIRHHGGEGFDIDILRIKNIIIHNLTMHRSEAAPTEGWEVLMTKKTALYSYHGHLKNKFCFKKI